ncbi:HTH-type transcriptional repressor NanR [Leucobacter aridicollis]|uniref:FadR/GntR family transcriptional regulator n=1 Tax=Leucobacter aridicollis TaxID=283878 RepID=UPI00216990F6|nr:GntR family transcriptional regulator [Leucobacter aridicollis]MCS3429156.1 DNA-binding FadR family transcriptional regulator [Leucobacter aridicollis]
MTTHAHGATPSRLRTAAFAPIGEEGRTDMVVSRLVQAISVGAFTEGERLPSENELSTLLGVAVVTVREALSELRHRDLIETRRGRNGGSFVRPSPAAVEEVNARTLLAESRVAIADLGVHYEVVSAACAEYACLRATAEELEIVADVLTESGDAPVSEWRRRITEVQLELAALSQSVRLTNEHVRLQTEFTPLLALQDLDDEARQQTHAAIVAQVEATQAGDVQAARSAVRESVRGSVRWLIAFRADLLAGSRDSDLRGTLEARRRRRERENRDEQ